MKKIFVILFCQLVISLFVFSGCAMFNSLGGEQTNYALAKNGATVNVSNITAGRDVNTIINGITSSEEWDKGDGWESSFTRRRPDNAGWNRLDPRTNLEYGSAWLEVQFKGEKIINKITVYTLDSKKYPSSRYGFKEAWIQVWKEYGWTSVGEILNSQIISKTNLDRRPAVGKLIFKFDPVKTNKIRLVVFQSNDVGVVGEGWSSDRKTENSVARVVEIEATGIQSAPSSGAFNQQWIKPAPEFYLQDVNDQWVKLSDFKGKIVVVVFWAVWSPEAQQEVRELNALSQYKDQNVVTIGISTDEGGAERILSFVQSNGLNYPILIADTGVKSAYGGIAKLPSTFIIDKNGNIYKEYLGYRRGNLIEVDVKNLLQNQ